MKTNKKLVLALLCLLVGLGCASFAWADPPDRVGRLNLISGTVSFHPGTVDDWAPATLNYPLTTGDTLWTDQDGEAEIHVGSSVIRLASNTQLSFLNLDDETMQIQLSTGSLNIRLRHLDPNEVIEIDTPNSSLTLSRTGSYRVDVQETGDTSLTVRSGEAEVTVGDSSFSALRDQSVEISGLDSPSHEVAAADPPDDWDEWCAARDRAEDRMVSAQYVPREMIGMEDLDANGTWRVDPGYGPVWQPTVVVAGWAPYRYGHWAWVDPWGWTWVDDTPWGFAPFHYGRWASLGGTWVWVPGRIVMRPVYAPALVVFVGGSGWGASHVAGGGVAWFPLGPREPYIPPYTVSNAYVRNVNISHVRVVSVTSVNVTTYRYVNRGVPGAVVAVPNQAFVRAQPVNNSAFVVSDTEIMQAPVRGTYAPLAPERESVLGRPVVGPGARPPAMVMSRPVVVRMAPPPPPVPFADRQQALQAHPGRPLDPGALQTLRNETPGPAPQFVIVNPRPPREQGPQGMQGGQGQHPGSPQGQQQPGPRVVNPGQPGPRVQPGGEGQSVQQRGPRAQPRIRRGLQGQVIPPGSGHTTVKPQGGPRQNPGASSDDLLKKKIPPDQGGQGQPAGPGGH
jgi:hypothetical protein